MKYFLPLTILLFLISCKNEPTTSSESPKVTEPPKQEQVEMMVYFNNLRLRDAAGEKANEIDRLTENTKVTYYGELSNFTTEGWVYAAGVKPVTSNPSEAIQILEKMRLHSFFGKGQATKIENYNKTLTQSSNSMEFAQAYENSVGLQETIAKELSDKIIFDDPQNLPAMDWLENSMKGFTTSLVAEGTTLYLFADYRQLSEMAKKTDGKEDDEFMQLQMSIFPIDSIEHFYPVWFLQTWDYGGHSLLGEGHHFKILEKVNTLLEKDSPFKKFLGEVKNQIIDDIVDTEKYVTYWYKKEKILSELNQIISANFVSLSQKDKIALTARKKMFEQPQKNAMKINQRSGE